MNLLLDTLSTPDTFRLWLSGHPSEAIVGTARNSNECPLANFLLAQKFCDCEVTTGNIAARFEKEFYWLSDRPITKNKLLPLWASIFVAVVDNFGMSEVPASRAIKALIEAVEVAELSSRDVA